MLRWKEGEGEEEGRGGGLSILKFCFIFTNAWMGIRVIHEKSDFKFLTSSSLILFIIVIRYIM